MNNPPHSHRGRDISEATPMPNAHREPPRNNRKRRAREQADSDDVDYQRRVRQRNREPHPSDNEVPRFRNPPVRAEPASQTQLPPADFNAARRELQTGGHLTRRPPSARDQGADLNNVREARVQRAQRRRRPHPFPNRQPNANLAEGPPSSGSPRGGPKSTPISVLQQATPAQIRSRIRSGVRIYNRQANVAEALPITEDDEGPDSPVAPPRHGRDNHRVRNADNRRHPPQESSRSSRAPFQGPPASAVVIDLTQDEAIEPARAGPVSQEVPYIAKVLTEGRRLLLTTPLTNPAKEAHVLLAAVQDDIEDRDLQSKGTVPEDPEVPKRTCGVCLEEKPEPDTIALNCPGKHVYCGACLVSHFNTLLAPEASTPPKCCNLIPLSKDVRSLLSRTLFTDRAGNLYEDAALLQHGLEDIFKRQARYLATKNPVHCYACHEWVENDGHNYNSAEKIATCNNGFCRATSCIVCKRSAHHNGLCPQDKDVQALFASAKASKLKQCPRCSAITEKSDGCNQMQCIVRGCGARYCYHCGELWSNSCKSHQYDRTRQLHFDKDVPLTEAPKELQDAIKQQRQSEEEEAGEIEPADCLHEAWRYTAKGKIYEKGGHKKEICVGCGEEHLWFMECKGCGTTGVCDQCTEDWKARAKRKHG